jgi:hypothetical protein
MFVCARPWACVRARVSHMCEYIRPMGTGARERSQRIALQLRDTLKQQLAIEMQAAFQQTTVAGTASQPWTIHPQTMRCRLTGQTLRPGCAVRTLSMHSVYPSTVAHSRPSVAQPRTATVWLGKCTLSKAYGP